MLQQLKISLVLCILLVIVRVCSSHSVQFVAMNRELIYEYEGDVNVVAQTPWHQMNLKPPQPAGWKVRGTLKLQRVDERSLAAALAVEKITVAKENGTSAVFYQNKEMQTLYNPFKIVYANEIVASVQFKQTDLLWSRNFKRAIAATLQVQHLKLGAYVEKEPGIHGICSTEYYVARKQNGHLSIRKTPELHTCLPHFGGIHSLRKNVPETICDDVDPEKIVIVGNEAIYDLAPIITVANASTNHGEKNTNNYYLNRVYVEGNTFMQTFESTGESQLVVSRLTLTHASDNEILNSIDVYTGMTLIWSNLVTEEHSISDVTGERQAFEPKELIQMAIDLLISLADSLEDGELNYDEPYESRVADAIRIFGRCDYESLQSLHEEINIGTSYRQETVRNLFYDIIPRAGTKASVMLTRDLIVRNLCKSTTAIQLLITLPLHIADASLDLVHECEILMALGPERPDVRQIGILTFATIVHNSYSNGKMSESSFEKYVKRYFDLFLDGYDYEQKLLYLQALGNLKLGKVVEYLDPIIRDERQPDDIRFMATWVKQSAADRLSPSEKHKNYETFWPIFENRSASLELRVSAFVTLLTSNPTTARLMSIHALMENEPNPHLVNFYRTTLLSLAGTTQPCYEKLRRLTSSMIRHLPKAPAKRYWVTGNYIFDYRSNEYGMGASLQTLLIGNGKTHLPQVAIFKLQQEALGKYTIQHTLYIKSRGLDHVHFGRIVGTKSGSEINLNKLREILSSLRMPTVTKVPVHLEIIVQIEGKTVMLIFLNQQSFNALTEGDMLNRIMKLLQTDSHINLQNLRWPFYSRYSVPTVLGTPTSFSIHSTALSSLRGNITQSIQAAIISRSHHIDVRHSTFTVVTSKSYNPFLNMEHSINREQGFLTYLPIQNEIQLDLNKQSLWFSFYRRNNLISGISLKSRIRTITRGRPLRTNETPYVDIVVSEGDPNLESTKLIDYEIEDLGLMVTGVSHPYDVMSHMKLMFHMEPSINTFVYHEMESLIKLWSLIRVNNIHIGTNKKFTLLFHNTKNTKLEGTIQPFIAKSDPFTADTGSQTIDKGFILTFEHKSDDSVLHNLAITMKMNSDFGRSNKLKLTTFVSHVDKMKQVWRLCTEATYEPIVFLQRPYSLRGTILFGQSNTTLSPCPQEQSQITFDAYANVLENAKAAYGRLASNGEQICPREMLKFNPTAQNKYCDRNIYRDLTTLNEYGVNFTFQNSPNWLEHSLKRLDHFVTSLSSEIDLYNFTDQIDAQVNTFSDKLQLTSYLNGKNVSIPNLPLWFNRNIDAKFDTPAQLAFSLGIIHMCSVVAGTANTFDDKSIALANYTKQNCSVLLAADCSATSRFGLFVALSQNDNGNEIYTLEVHVDDNVIWYAPRKDGNDFIRFKNMTEMEVVSKVRPFGDVVDLSVYINAENLIIFEIFGTIQIQYYRNNILTVKVPSSIKGNLCGVCSLPFNTGDAYQRCS